MGKSPVLISGSCRCIRWRRVMCLNDMENTKPILACSILTTDHSRFRRCHLGPTEIALRRQEEFPDLSRPHYPDM